MKLVMKFAKPIAFVLGVSAFFYGMAIYASALLGAGHGTGFFIEALFSPSNLAAALALDEPVGYLFWPTVAALLSQRHFLGCRIAAAALLAIHYLGIIILCMDAGQSGVRRAFSIVGDFKIPLLAAYLASQILMWVLILRRPRRLNGAPVGLDESATS